MKLLKLLFIIFSSAHIYCSFAAPVSVCLWQPFGQGLKIVVPSNVAKKTIDGPSFCKLAVQKYVDTVNAETDLRSMMNNATLTIPNTSIYSLFSLRRTSVAERPNMIILANEFNQISDPSEFVMTNFINQFTKAGADLFVLPVAADITLGTQSLEFRNLIANNFDSMLAIGGEDINPSLYNEILTNAIPNDIHKVRDAHEILFHQSFIAQKKGVFYAICRGHQLAAVSQGQTLYQDIYSTDQYNSSLHTTTAHSHGAWHSVELNDDSIFTNWAYTEIQNGKRIMWVNSFHHEAVNFPLKTSVKSKNLRVTAFEQDDPNAGDSHKIVEAIESYDGKYISMQFHPEGMDQDLHNNGQKIIKGMVDHAALMRGH